MNNLEFLSEVHDYIDSSYQQFEHYQEIAFDILCEFDRVCRENGIQYFLAYGSLLGAVRDKNLIPWDYDIDVQIFQDDKDKLIDILKTKLGQDYYYAYLDNTPKYPAYCIRVGKKGHHFNALHVDVFFLIGCPEEEKEQERFFSRLNRYCEKRLSKYSAYWFGDTRSRLGKISNMISRFKAIWISVRKLNAEEKAIASAYPFQSSKYCCSLARDKKPYLSKSFKTAGEIEIRGRKMFVPAGWKDVLDKMYNGKWSDYLPVRNRFEEFYDMLKTVEDREKDQ